MNDESDIRVEPSDGSGRWHPSQPGGPRADTIGGRTGEGLIDRLTPPVVRRLRDRPPPRALVAAVAAVLGGALVAGYIQQSAEPVLPGPVLTRPIVTPETWLSVEVRVAAPDPFASSRFPRDDWQRAIAEHPPEAVLVLPLDGTPRLLGLPPGRLQLWGSCHPHEFGLAGEPPQVTVWIRHPEFVRDEPGSPLSCDGGVHPLAVIEDSPEYRPFEGYRFFRNDDADSFDPELGMVVVSFTTLD